ncbi:aminotransferase class I/II-fold pyridoxal phosphate-dependent enzyme [Pseudovibrio sp. Tun.PSC04-5.I4]|uniref:pyridoxal phosphate-dependent aminotransferase n=1 Tax=Pseudovibrio sp. Tun.PSC04-5.I4 TaxID=1798213 RepID=UPI001AD8AECA|nr:aminotransferase class I/II-fold pyridoxal phosphate-dependent enzyme [Pseudovibrio sp. Tun.PSC04-5.I4]
MLTGSKRSEVLPFQAMEVLNAANKLEQSGEHVLHMEVGQPGAPIPDSVLRVAHEHLSSGRLGYTEAQGIPKLKQSISRYYQRNFGLEVPVERIFATTGSSAGFNLAFLAGFDPGDRIAITSPGYPAYRNIIEVLGLECVEIEVGPETRWSLTPELLEKAHREKPLKGVLVASPANPTGTMMSPQALKELVVACDVLDLWFISDEIYHGLAYDMEEETALRFTDKAIIVNSFSKYYCMTGWRIGWMVLPEVLVRPVERIAQSLYISPPELAQVTAAAAFDASEDYERIKAGYAANREILLEHLPQLGFDVLPVDGAFYVYAGVTKLTNDSMEFCQRMLAEIHIAATPGADFDLTRGHQFIRFSFAGQEDVVKLAVDRLKHWLK